jgi:hypothetical protein
MWGFTGDFWPSGRKIIGTGRLATQVDFEGPPEGEEVLTCLLVNGPNGRGFWGKANAQTGEVSWVMPKPKRGRVRELDPAKKGGGGSWLAHSPKGLRRVGVRPPPKRAGDRGFN